MTVSPERLETLDLLPTFRGRPRGFPAAASWVQSSDIRLQAGFAPNEDLVLLAPLPPGRPGVTDAVMR